MKRNTKDDDDDSDSNHSDDGLFCYGNKKALTFSKRAKLDEACEISDDTDDDSDSDSDADSGSSSDSLVEIVGSNQKRRVDKNESSIIESESPPPPPAVNVMASTIQRKSCNDAITNRLLEAIQMNDFLCNTSSEFDSPKVANTVNLKVRIHGVIKRYPVPETELLERLYSRIATDENVEKGRISLNYGNNIIKESDTARSLKFTVASIIECLVSETLEEKDDDDENRITIKIQEKNGNRTVLRLNVSVKLEKCLKDFCNSKDLVFERCVFKFDGDEFSPSEASIESLGIEEGDIVDIL